jgi:hypothetical protein
MLISGFLAEFKRATEAKWTKCSINPTLYGFQFQSGTRWNPGLSEEEIEQYESTLSVQFPHDFKAFLRAMNGTDLPTLNVYGYCGEPTRESVGAYSYPRDLELVQRLMNDVRDRQTLTTTMAEEGFNLPLSANLVPIYGHRYIVCTSDPDSSAVLSIDGNDDAIVYGTSLRAYLEREFLGAGS